MLSPEIVVNARWTLVSAHSSILARKSFTAPPLPKVRRVDSLARRLAAALRTLTHGRNTHGGQIIERIEKRGKKMKTTEIGSAMTDKSYTT